MNFANVSGCTTQTFFFFFFTESVPLRAACCLLRLKPALSSEERLCRYRWLLEVHKAPLTGPASSAGSVQQHSPAAAPGAGSAAAILRLGAALAAAAGRGGRATPAGRLPAPPEVATWGHPVCRHERRRCPRACPCPISRTGRTAPQRKPPPARSSPPKMAAVAIPVPGCAGRPGLGKMAAAGASGRGGLCRAWVLSGWALGLCSLLASGTRPASATTHWVVTEDGKIQQQVRGPAGAGNCPPPPAPAGAARCGGRESPPRRSPAAPARPELCGVEPVGAVRSPARPKAATAGRRALLRVSCA